VQSALDRVKYKVVFSSLFYFFFCVARSKNLKQSMSLTATTYGTTKKRFLHSPALTKLRGSTQHQHLHLPYHALSLNIDTCGGAVAL
jgi:hypothetical protein